METFEGSGLGGLAEARHHAPTATFALAAQDRRKADLLRLVRAHRRYFVEWRVVATGNTGMLLDEQERFPVERLADGNECGALQIAALVVEGSVDAVVFLRDALSSQGHDPGLEALLRACDVHGVPVATNLATAEILIHHQADHDERVARTRAALEAAAAGAEPAGVSEADRSRPGANGRGLQLVGEPRPE